VEQITQKVGWQFLNGKFARIIFRLIREARIFQQGRVAQA
jgi:hypothetical protein